MKIKDIFEDESAPMGDYIISQYEAGKITYDQAEQKLKDAGATEWGMELKMARELMIDAGKTSAQMH